MSKIRLFFVFVVFLGLVEALYFYPILPDCMAIHFNAAGTADGWGPKGPFFITGGIVYLTMIVVFGGLPFLIRTIPLSLINLPNKDYWLAPERKQETMQRMMNQFLFFGALTLLLLDGVFLLTFWANLQAAPSLPLAWMLGMIIGFFAVSIIWIVSLIRSFRRPK